LKLVSLLALLEKIAACVKPEIAPLDRLSKVFGFKPVTRCGEIEGA
jgi:hypothetical protein